LSFLPSALYPSETNFKTRPSAAELPAITSVIRSTNSVAYDLETCDQRKGDRLDPWQETSVCCRCACKGKTPRALGYDLGALKSAF
jgi:hypothetical protein